MGGIARQKAIRSSIARVDACALISLITKNSEDQNCKHYNVIQIQTIGTAVAVIVADRHGLFGGVIWCYAILSRWQVGRRGIHPEIHKVPRLSLIDRPSMPPGFFHFLLQSSE